MADMVDTMQRLVTIGQLKDGVISRRAMNALLNDIFPTDLLQCTLQMTNFNTTASLRYPQMQHHHCLKTPKHYTLRPYRDVDNLPFLLDQNLFYSIIN